MEVVMALAVIGSMGAGCYVGFNSLNTYAVSSRLYSEAQTAAQNQIDQILSKENRLPEFAPSPAASSSGDARASRSCRSRSSLMIHSRDF